MQKYPLGPVDWPDWVKRMLPGSAKFANASIAHDWLYEYAKDEDDRKRADVLFLILCLESSPSIGWEFLSAIYYLLVRVGGKNRINKQ